MIYIILLNLHVIVFFINLIIKRFKIIFISYLAISYILVYSIIIILKILNKINNSIKLELVKYWLT